MQRFATSVAVILLLGSGGVGAREDFFFSQLSELAGPSAKACGTVKLREDPSSIFACATHAMAAGTSFWVAAEVQGTDSHLWRGVALAPDKKVWLLSYDSDVQGGGGDGKESLNYGFCREVQFSAERGIYCP